MESRELFWGINTQQLIMFYMLGTASMLIFLYGAYAHIAKYARGSAMAHSSAMLPNKVAAVRAA